MVISDRTVRKNRVLKVITLYSASLYSLQKVTEKINQDVLLEESTDLAPFDEHLTEGYEEHE